MSQAPTQKGPGTSFKPGSQHNSSAKIGSKTVGTSPNSDKRGKQGE